MVKIFTKEEAIENKEFIIKEMIKGKIFIYPTDTLIGLGCNAKLDLKVENINKIKKRDENKTCLIIAPSFNWIENNCIVNKDKFEYMSSKLPGPYSFILKVKENIDISKLILRNSTIGIRLPNNWFKDFIREAQIPFISTSVNIAGEKSALSYNEINEEIKEKVDYIILDEKISKKASTIIDLTKDSPELIR